MTTLAIVFLVLSALIIWGGLAFSIVLLRRDVPEPDTDELVHPYGAQPQDAPVAVDPPRPARNPRRRRGRR